MGKTLCFTGHRPDKLGGYDPKDNKALLWEIQRTCIRYIEAYGVTDFVNGVALGIDQWSALIVIKLKTTYPQIRLISAVPCLGHNSKWLPESKKLWQHIINNSDEVIQVTEELYTKECMQLRNEVMVNISDYVLGVWDGTAGGTKNCLRYAASVKEEDQIEIINPKTLQHEIFKTKKANS